MKIMIDIDENVFTRLFDNGIQDNEIAVDDVCEMARALRLGTPLPEHLNKIKDDIGRYELDCRFSDYSQTDACTICNKNVFESIYRIIDNRLAESEDEE